MKTAREIYRDTHMKYGVPGGKADRYDIEAMEEYANLRVTDALEAVKDSISKSLDGLIQIINK